MRGLDMSTIYFFVCLCSIPFSVGLFESQNTLLKHVGGQLSDVQNAEKRPRENSKFGVFSNPFGNKHEEGNSESIKPNMPTNVNNPDSSKPSDWPIATKRSKTDGVRRKFRTKNPSWMLSMLGKRRQGMKDTKDKNPTKTEGSHLNPFANPSEKQDFLPVTTEGTSNVDHKGDETNVNTKPAEQNADVHANTKPAGQETDVGNSHRASSEYEFGGESLLVPCQWGGCLEGYHCMRFVQDRAIDCQEDTNEFCQCMREKSQRKTQGQAEAESGSLKTSVSKTDGGGALPYNIPQDMEVGGESLAGVPCQYAGCLENFQCMTIDKGQLIVCDTDSMDICQCMRKSQQQDQEGHSEKSSTGSQGIANIQTTIIPPTEVPLVMGTDSVIPCQFWGCETGFRCLLVIDGHRTACPSNSNAVCQCLPTIQIG